ncbi:putative serine/threonine protein kinase [Cafeteria roenbergensis virus]|uniref:Putative serine/threonine protein kinase n=1 Tax=Cafeteria roenbergensis virus (strain BV-PW1) TaxID=693272 RepID=E3T580_CROVB|nr:putative serine/threonine protein kinase [Cafeteria roenbergensis virus BV-PW1]ADO67343.1 putative serine/threonine protein kinase [Cafeteria roenbergensis virus BV-PW1]
MVYLMDSSNMKKLKKKFNLITQRLGNIESLIKENPVESLVNWYKSKNIDSLTNDDIRDILPKKNYDFGKVIEQIGGKLLYIKSGSTGHTFRGVYLEEVDKPSYALKVVAYPRKENYGDVYSPSRPENAELIILSILSQFVLSNQTPHIILPICTFNTSISPFVGLPKNDFVKNKKYDQFVERYKNKEYYSNVSILISEWASYGDLGDFLKKKYHKFTLKHWKVLFFQIISVLAVIHKKYPQFRHNDLKANNILVDKVPISKKYNRYMYEVNGQSYVIPTVGFNIKLWDFDFACIPGLADNSKVSAKWTSKININPIQNRYYDLHYFFNTLTQKGFMANFFEDSLIPNEVKEFIHRIIPEPYREPGKYVSERGRILINDEITTPDWVIKNDLFFGEFRT